MFGKTVFLALIFKQNIIIYLLHLYFDNNGCAHVRDTNTSGFENMCQKISDMLFIVFKCYI